MVARAERRARPGPPVWLLWWSCCGFVEVRLWCLHVRERRGWGGVVIRRQILMCREACAALVRVSEECADACLALDGDTESTRLFGEVQVGPVEVGGRHRFLC